MGEATVPAEQTAPRQATRVPAPDVDAGRPGDHQGAPRQGSRPPVGLKAASSVRPGPDRISDRATFQSFRRARRARIGLLTVARVAGDPPARVAYAVSRKVGGAVVRNRLRRRLRELARASASAGSLGGGAWLVIAAPGAGSGLVPMSCRAGGAKPLRFWHDRRTRASFCGRATAAR